MSVKLKPCPFCGEDDLKIFQNAIRDNDNKPTDKDYFFVSCRGDCHFAGPSSIDSLDNAVSLWNNRDNSINLNSKKLDEHHRTNLFKNEILRIFKKYRMFIYGYDNGPFIEKAEISGCYANESFPSDKIEEQDRNMERIVRLI